MKKNNSKPYGAFCFVLHSHIPYVKKAGFWPFGEEWLLEGLLETYIPLLDVLYQLKENKVSYKIAVSLTPILMEQLSDEYFIKRFEEFMAERIKRSEQDIAKFIDREQNDYRKLAEFYKKYFTKILGSFTEKYNRDIIGAFRVLQNEDYVEVMTSAATHGYLPLLSRDSSVYAQIKVGIDTYRKYFGRKPKGIWLPECAYRQAKTVHVTKTESYVKPSIDEFLAAQGIEYFLVDSHAIEGGKAYFGTKRTGVYGEIKAPEIDFGNTSNRTTYLPYISESGTVAFGRNKETGLQVWSGEHGYPGDGNYREFHKKDSDTGLQYWRITSTKVDIGMKEIYNPENTHARINENACHFNEMVGNLLRKNSEETQEHGIVVSPYDTELFGHWWFEGIEWLKQVLEKMSGNPSVEMITPSEYLKKYPPKYVAKIPESSWGDGGGHFVWFNSETEWMWPYVHNAEICMEDIIQKYKPEDIKPVENRALNQAARELLLLQSSDWPFLVTTKQAKEYAVQRFLLHYNRFGRIISALEEKRCGNPEFINFLAEIENVDSAFKEIDYRKFSRIEPPTAEKRKGFK